MRQHDGGNRNQSSALDRASLDERFVDEKAMDSSIAVIERVNEDERKRNDASENHRRKIR